MNKVSLAKGIYFVGAVDWNQRDFHGYATPRGVTYNSYLIVDEKICLIDTVKAPFAGELLDRIRDIVDPAKIDYIVVNHVEPDHSSALPAILEQAVKAKVVITAQGKTETIKHYQHEYDFLVVKEGDSLKLGQHTLHFVPVPMLHWPDSMASYLDGEEILFSNDAFGQHICTTKHFDDENDIHDVLYEAGKYYANILMPYSRLAVKAVDKIAQLPVKMIAPSHGVIWRKHIPEIMEKYRQWGQGYTNDKVVIVYDTMWGGTEQMARRILDGVAAAGVKASLYRLPNCTRSAIIEDMLEAKGIIIGSSTLNGQVLPTIGGLLFYLKGLKPLHKIGTSFGAYGWAGGAQADLEGFMKAAGIEQCMPGLFIKWTPDSGELDRCFDFGLTFGKSIQEKQA